MLARRRRRCALPASVYESLQVCRITPGAAMRMEGGPEQVRKVVSGNAVAFLASAGSKASTPVSSTCKGSRYLGRARYVMEVGGRYIVSYGCNNPAGLANDAGDEHANVTGEGGGRMAVTRNIEIGEEIYW